MKKQLLLSTLTVIAITGCLHADKNKPRESARKEKVVTEETVTEMAKIVVAESEDQKEKQSDVKRKKGKKDQDKGKKASKKEKKDKNKK